MKKRSSTFFKSMLVGLGFVFHHFVLVSRFLLGLLCVHSAHFVLPVAFVAIVKELNDLL